MCKWILCWGPCLTGHILTNNPEPFHCLPFTGQKVFTHIGLTLPQQGSKSEFLNWFAFSFAHFEWFACINAFKINWTLLIQTFWRIGLSGRTMTGIEIKPKVYSQTIKQVQVLVEKVELFSLNFGIFVFKV